MVTNTAELRAMLLETIEQIRADKIDTKKALAIGALTGQVIRSAKLDLDASRINRAKRSGADVVPTILVAHTPKRLK